MVNMVHLTHDSNVLSLLSVCFYIEKLRYICFVYSDRVTPAKELPSFNQGTYIHKMKLIYHSSCKNCIDNKVIEHAQPRTSSIYLSFLVLSTI